MIRPRYLAFLPCEPGADADWKDRLDASIATGFGLMTIVDHPGLHLMAASPGLGLGGENIVVGEVFRRDDCAPVRSLELAENRAIIATGGTRLVDEYWGAYLAILSDEDGGFTVLRAPLGDLPVYVWQSQHGLVIASDVELLVRIAGYRPSIDWVGVAEHLVAPDLRRPRTCLAGLYELSGGSRGRWHRGAWTVDDIWSPWGAVAAEPLRVDSRDAAELLASTIQSAVTARFAQFDRVLGLVSGGLDSSIVAACVADMNQTASALTMVTRDRGGDERHYAEALTSHLGMSLRSVLREPVEIDLFKSAAAGLPRPSARSFAQATQTAAHVAARETGAQAIVHGGGGDNVFCSVQSAAPLTDRLLAGGDLYGSWKVAGDIAMLTQASVGRVFWQAMRRLRRDPAYRIAGDRSLLSPSAIAAASPTLDHPWLRPPPGAMPGSAAHIGLIAAAQSLVESPDSRAAVPSVAPLIAQPIVEACVAIPSWHWFDRGHNRAVARHAFDDRLPKSIAWRRSKGAMDSFVIEIFERNRDVIAKLLGHGLLAAHGIIDGNAIAAILDEKGPTRGHGYARLMHFADVEAWLRSWTSV